MMLQVTDPTKSTETAPEEELQAIPSTSTSTHQHSTSNASTDIDHIELTITEPDLKSHSHSNSPPFTLTDTPSSSFSGRKRSAKRKLPREEDDQPRETERIVAELGKKFLCSPSRSEAFGMYVGTCLDSIKDTTRRLECTNDLQAVLHAYMVADESK